MMDIIILAVVQGIAEFLPVSSSAHLIIFRDIFGVGGSISENVTLAFDVALHFGTLLAIVVYFFKDLFKIFIDGVKRPKEKEGKMLWYLVIATIPAAISGFLFEDYIDSVIRSNYFVIAFQLAVVGIILYKVDKHFEQKKTIDKITLKDAFLIGCAQMIALIPGTSRSGATITAARALKLDRESAAKFSFYLSAPIVLGATVVTLLKDGTTDIISGNLGIFIGGILVSFITGLLVIEFLLKYIRKNDFKLFMNYRIVMAIIVIIGALL